MFHLLFPFTFAFLSAAWPLSVLPRGRNPIIPTATEYTSTFEDECRFFESIALENVGPYNGLYYDEIRLLSLGVENTDLPGIDPASGTKVGGFGIRSKDPKITTQYVGSATDIFDFEKLKVGCAVSSQESFTSLPIPCKVRVRGYKAAKEVAGADQIFKFNPDPLMLLKNLLVADMVEAVLNDKFKGIDTVRFDTDYGLLSPAGATVIDDLKYTTYNAKAVSSKDIHKERSLEHEVRVC